MTIEEINNHMKGGFIISLIASFIAAFIFPSGYEAIGVLFPVYQGVIWYDLNRKHKKTAQGG